MVFFQREEGTVPSKSENSGSESPKEMKTQACAGMWKIYVSGWQIAFPQCDLLPVIAIIWIWNVPHG